MSLSGYKSHSFQGEPSTYSHPQAVTGIVGAITVVLKLHKHALLGGAWVSTGAIAVVAEDISVFLVLFGLFRLGNWAIVRTVSQRGTAGRGAAAALHRLVLYTLAIAMLLFIGIEHMYFCSTRLGLGLPRCVFMQHFLLTSGVLHIAREGAW